MVSVVDLGDGAGSSAGPDAESAKSFVDSAEELTSSPVPAVVLEIPTERIVAASPSGALLLRPDGGSVAGRNFEDFTTDGPSGLLDLFASGRVTGYEATRMLRRPGRPSLAVSAWLHKFGHQSRSRFALVVLSVPEAVRTTAETSPEGNEPTVVGTTDTSLMIERVSNDALALFGCSSGQLLGQPLAGLVAEDESARLMAGVDEASTTNRAVTLLVRAPTLNGASKPGPMCHAVLLPMEPPPSCAFVFLPVPDIAGLTATYAPDPAGLLRQLHRGASVAGIARRLSRLGDRDIPGLNELSTREWEIVTRLLDGDRVPVIASELFLSPSTVRTHLALVFGKVHVSSQQELLDLLRHKRITSRA